MILVVWNSRGSKWDIAYNNFLVPQLTFIGDAALLLVESGWAPWVQSGEVMLNKVYGLDSTKEWYNQPAAANSAFCQAVEGNRNNRAFWTPWATLKTDKTHTRCSMGGAIFPDNVQFQSIK